MLNLSDDTSLLLITLMGLLSAITFMCLYMQEKRRAPEQRTPLGGFVTFLLYLFPIAIVILVCMGIAVMLDTGNPQILLPTLTNGMAAATVWLWGRTKRVR